MIKLSTHSAARMAAVSLSLLLGCLEGSTRGGVVTIDEMDGTHFAVSSVGAGSISGLTVGPGSTVQFLWLPSEPTGLQWANPQFVGDRYIDIYDRPGGSLSDRFIWEPWFGDYQRVTVEQYPLVPVPPEAVRLQGSDVFEEDGSGIYVNLFTDGNNPKYAPDIFQMKVDPPGSPEPSSLWLGLIFISLLWAYAEYRATVHYKDIRF